MKISKTEIIYDKLKKDIEETFLEWSNNTRNEESQATILKVAIEEYLNKKKQEDDFSFLDVDICTYYYHDDKSIRIDIVPKNKETFEFFRRNNPFEYSNYDWDDESDSLIMYM